MLKGPLPDKSPLPPKRNWERRLRHASRIAKPKRPVVKEGRALDDDSAEGRTLADQWAWTDW